MQGHLSGQASLLACGEGGAAGWRGGWGPAVSACAWSCPGQEQEGGDSGGRASPVPPSTQSLRRGRGAPRVGETQDQNTILMFSAYPVGLLRSWNGTLGGAMAREGKPRMPFPGEVLTFPICSLRHCQPLVSHPGRCYFWPAPISVFPALCFPFNIPSPPTHVTVKCCWSYLYN